jgi:ferredoxin
MTTTPTDLERYLQGHDDHDWRRAAGALEFETNEVDRPATRIWLAFYPIALARLLDQAPDADQLARELLLQGRWRLADQVDSSHWFFYSHRYWPTVKRAAVLLAEQTTGRVAGPLAGVVRDVAQSAATELSMDRTIVMGIAAVAVNTLQQVGLEALRAAPGAVTLDAATLARTPRQVLAARARDDRQGLFGSLRGERKVWTVTFDERDPEGRFSLINTQALTTAAAADPRDWRARDPRCAEGPIPVQCRSASCGTCWVGVLGGADKLSDVEPRERERLREFGYADTSTARPLIRLACQASATGAVSIVIPPWNGVFGRALERHGAAAPGR